MLASITAITVITVITVISYILGPSILIYYY